MTKLNDLINRHGANAFVYMDAGNGSVFGENGVIIDFDEEAEVRYGQVELAEIPSDQTHRTEDGTEYLYISDWVEGQNGYRYRIGF